MLRHNAVASVRCGQERSEVVTGRSSLSIKESLSNFGKNFSFVFIVFFPEYLKLNLVGREKNSIRLVTQNL